MINYLHLHNTIRHYDWGSHTALAHLQGRERSAQPEAELWIGAHPAAPSTVRMANTSDPEPLGTMLQREGASWFGDSASRFGNQLPFLLKILTAAKPLSLQVHPTRERAAAIFAAQDQSVYVDANHKPEVLCALTEFRALQGFRPFSEAALVLAHVSCAPSKAEDAIDVFRARPNATSMRLLLSQLLSLSPSEATTLAKAVHRSCSQLAPRHPGGPTPTALAVDLLYQHYPNDALVLAPLLLNVVVMQPGEAIYTGAGTLHSYLQGTGVELMSTSDNVLRAGLTPKEINIEELMQVTRFEELAVAPLPTEGPPTSFVSFPTPAQEFELAVLNLADHQNIEEPEPREIQILLCTAGKFKIQGLADEAQFRPLGILSGEALLVRARSGPYSLSGKGQLFRATVPA